MSFSEEFSSLSISASLSTDKPTYPRGIINPNYPGFQHLAHTLSEHFVDHHGNQVGSMSDSDFSEVDSDFPSEGHSSENNNTFVCDDSNGNNIIEERITTKIDNLSTVEEILRTVFESNSSHLTTAIEMLSEKELMVEQTNIEIDASDLATDLNSYLKHYEDAGINMENVEPFAKKLATPSNEPPDVIRKSNSCEHGFEQNVDRPDILLDVTVDGTVPNGEKDEPGSAWSITPVDIVGNFEQEVERELGLLVTGYRNNSFRSDSDEVDSRVNISAETNEQFLKKTVDAALSCAKDTIQMDNALPSDDQNQTNEETTQIHRDSNVDELVMKNHIPTAIVKPKYQRSSFDDRQLPTIAYMNDDKAAWYEKPTTTIETSKCSAPVAVATHPKKIHLPEFDRKAKKHLKSTNSSMKSAHTNADTVHNYTTQTDNTSGESDGKETVCCAVTNHSVVPKSKTSTATSVAVVQPRKKERMDKHKLMETIVQMQIKKNAQLYRGQGNNNKSNPVAVKPRPINPINGNTEYLNKQSNVNNNNNDENYAAANKAKNEQKETSGKPKQLEKHQRFQ